MRRCAGIITVIYPLSSCWWNGLYVAKRTSSQQALRMRYRRYVPKILRSSRWLLAISVRTVVLSVRFHTRGMTWFWTSRSLHVSSFLPVHTSSSNQWKRPSRTKRKWGWIYESHVLFCAKWVGDFRNHDKLDLWLGCALGTLHASWDLLVSIKYHL